MNSNSSSSSNGSSNGALDRNSNGASELDSDQVHSNGESNGHNGVGDGILQQPIKCRTEQDIIRLIGQHLRGLGLE